MTHSVCRRLGQLAASVSLNCLAWLIPAAWRTDGEHRHGSRGGARRRFGRRVGSLEPLEVRQALSVTFHGGNLLPHAEAQAVYLGSDWSTNSTLVNEAASVDRYLSYLVQSPYMDMLAQAGYGVGVGSAVAGKDLNVAINKTSGITDAQIRADLQSAISSSQLSTPDAERLYVVYVEPGVKIQNGADSSATSFLGYHGAFAGRDASGKFVDVRYAVIVHPGAPNPNAGSQGFASNFDQLTSVTSHEFAEAVTDPDVNYKALGWYDDRLNGEIGDLTRKNSVLNGYLVQDVVDKNDQPIAPVTTSPITPPINPPITPALAAPQNVTANALSPTDVRISWSSVADAAGYRIFRMIGSQPTLLGTVGASATSATVTGLTPGSTNIFVVEAYRGSTTADSAAVRITMPAQAALRVTATALSFSTVQLSWGNVSGAEAYNIYWWNGTRAVLLGTVAASTTSVRVGGLIPGMTNQFLVEAVTGSTTVDSDWATVTTPRRLFPFGPWGGWY